MSSTFDAKINPSTTPSASVENAHGVSYLVQYNANSHYLVQAIVQREAISWPIGNLKLGKRVLVRDGQTHRLAVLLRISGAIECMTALDKVRQQCQQHVANLPPNLRYQKTNSLEVHSWLLVHYSLSMRAKVYAVVNVNEIVWRGKNYSCPFIKAVDGHLHEASIWCCSKKLLEMEKVLSALRVLHDAAKPASDALQLPDITELEEEMQEEHSLNYYCHYLRLDDKQKMLKSLDRLEEKLKHDSVEIDATTKAIARTCRKLDKILSQLYSTEIY